MTNFSDAKLDTLWGSDAALQEEKPGMSVSDALALRDLHPGRFPLTDLEDGDFLMTSLAVWTAAHDGIPLMIVVAHKRSFTTTKFTKRKSPLTVGDAVEPQGYFRVADGRTSFWRCKVGQSTRELRTPSTWAEDV